MHKAVYDYTSTAEGLKSLIPPMPDFYCRHADGVYALQPLTPMGRRFIAERDGFGDYDEIRFRGVELFDVIFDLGLKVV